MPGTRVDGMDFAAKAAALGALAVMGEHDRGLPPGIAFVRVPDARRALSHVAAAFYPRQPGTIVAVTGTSGKTSVAAFVRQIFARLGHQAASIGTVGLVAPWGETYGSLTTPDPIELHRLLDEIAGQRRHAISPWRPPRMGSTSTGSTASAWRRAASPISAAIISTIIRVSRPIATQSFACSRELLPPGAGAVIEADHAGCRGFRRGGQRAWPRRDHRRREGPGDQARRPSTWKATRSA